MDKVGVRELRNHTADAVRRAAAGQRIVVTVDGRPTAQLGPLEPVDGPATLDDLAARGWVEAPARTDRPVPEVVVHLPTGARLDRLLRDVLGADGPARAVTLALDTSALLARHVSGPHHEVVVDACGADADWCASAVAQAEAVALVDRIATDAPSRQALLGAVLEDWSRLAVVPVDRACLDRAGQLARAHPLRLVDALHLAAALRLPRPVTFVTFDPRQIPVALALGLEVVST